VSERTSSPFHRESRGGSLLTARGGAEMSAVVLLCGNVFDVPPMPRGRHRSTPGTQTSLLRCSKQHHIRIADFQGANKLGATARLRPLRARPRFARLKPMPCGRSSCPTVAMASGGLFIGATRRGADGFGFGGAQRTDEFESAQVRGRATPLEARSGASLMQNSGAKGRFGSTAFGWEI